ncbi:MAG TPA: sugar transporter, partial [Shewanella frigidimarina]|nr:sugar transporter [Shewanella frigidimarina]
QKQTQLKRFGYDLFAGSPTTFAPVSDVPVPYEYMIGPGDNINVQLYGKENKNYQLIVGRDGAVQFPDLGPISLVGLSFSEAKAFLQDKIAKSIIGI